MADKRPDLAAVEATYPASIHEFVAPTLVRYQKSGDLFYQPIASAVTAQTNRSKFAEATATNFADAHVAYACAEVIGMPRISYDDIVDSYGSKDKAELAMARAAKRSIDGQIEAAVANAVLADALDFSAITTGLAGKIEDEAFKLRNVYPQAPTIAIAMSSTVFTKLKSNEEIKSRMSFTGIELGTDGNPRRVTEAQMASILGVDKVYVGRASEWGATTLALFLEPAAGVQPNEECQLARWVSYQTELDNNPFACETFEMPKESAYYVKMLSYGVLKTLNSSMKKAIQVFEDESSSI